MSSNEMYFKRIEKTLKTLIIEGFESEYWQQIEKELERIYDHISNQSTIQSEEIQDSIHKLNTLIIDSIQANNFRRADLQFTRSRTGRKTPISNKSRDLINHMLTELKLSPKDSLNKNQK